jgi:hypothetical protein
MGWASGTHSYKKYSLHTEFWRENLKRPLGRPYHSREDNIKTNLEGNSIRRCGRNSSVSGQGQITETFVYMVMTFRFP